MNLSHVLEITMLFFTLIKLSQNAERIVHSRMIKPVLIILLLWVFESIVCIFWLEENILGYDYKRPLNFFEYLVIIVVFLINIDKKILLRKVFHVYLLSAFVILFLTLLKSIGFDIPGFERNLVYKIGIFRYGVTAIFENADTYSALCLPLIPATIISLKNGYPLNLKKPLLLILLLINMFLISLNGSRGTMLSIAGSFYISLYFLLKYSSYDRRIANYLGYLFLGALLVAFIVNAYDIIDFASNIRRQTVEQRIIGYRLGIELFFENIYYFLFGAGKEKFIGQLDIIIGKKGVPHNSIVEELVSDGLLGFLIMVAFFYRVIKVSFNNTAMASRIFDKDMRELSLILLLSVLSICLEGIFANITPTYPLWIVIALMLCLNNYLAREVNESSLHKFEKV